VLLSSSRSAPSPPAPSRGAKIDRRIRASLRRNRKLCELGETNEGRFCITGGGGGGGGSSKIDDTLKLLSSSLNVLVAPQSHKLFVDDEFLSSSSGALGVVQLHMSCFFRGTATMEATEVTSSTYPDPISKAFIVLGKVDVGEEDFFSVCLSLEEEEEEKPSR